MSRPLLRRRSLGCLDQLRDTQPPLAVLLGLAGKLPSHGAGTAVHDPTLTRLVEPHDHQHLRFGPIARQGNRVLGRRLDLHGNAISGPSVEPLIGGPHQFEPQLLSSVDLAERSDEMTIRRHRAVKPSRELSAIGKDLSDQLFTGLSHTGHLRKDRRADGLDCNSMTRNSRRQLAERNGWGDGRETRSG